MFVSLIERFLQNYTEIVGTGMSCLYSIFEYYLVFVYKLKQTCGTSRIIIMPENYWPIFNTAV